jgi:hypothetical protein
MQLIRLLCAPFLRQRKIQMRPPEVEEGPRVLLQTERRRTAAPQMHIELSVKACTSAVFVAQLMHKPWATALVRVFNWLINLQTISGIISARVDSAI